MKKLRKLSRLAGEAFAGAVLVALGVTYGVAYVNDPFWSSGQKTGLVLLLPAAWGMAVLAHELGHVLAGWTQGFGFRWMAVGPFRWTTERGRGRLTWHPDQPAAGGLHFLEKASVQRKEIGCCRTRLKCFFFGQTLCVCPNMNLSPTQSTQPVAFRGEGKQGGLDSFPGQG